MRSTNEKAGAILSDNRVVRCGKDQPSAWANPGEEFTMMHGVELIQVRVDALREADGSGAPLRLVENRAAAPLGTLGDAIGP